MVWRLDSLENELASKAVAISTLEAKLEESGSVASRLTKSEDEIARLEKLLTDQENKPARQKYSEISNLEARLKAEHKATVHRLIASKNDRLAQLHQENAALKAKLQLWKRLARNGPATGQGHWAPRATCEASSRDPAERFGD